MAKNTSIWNADDERDYSEMRRLGSKLHIPVAESFWTIETFLDGKLSEIHRERAHSFNRNAYNVDMSQLGGKNGVSTFGPGLLSIKRIDAVIAGNGIGLGQSTGSPIEVVGTGYRAGPAIDTFGILVGTGVNANSFEDFALQTKVANGTGAGQMSYVQSELAVQAYDGGTLTMTVAHARFFNNNSGGDIGINEVALASNGLTGGGNLYAIVTRDKLGGTVTVLNTGQLKVTYTVSLVYPA